MQPTPEDTRNALLKLLSVVAGSSGADVDVTQPAGKQINLCIERTKAEASEGAALIDACAPHGRAMLAQAQKRLQSLQALKVLESVASESFGMLYGKSLAGLLDSLPVIATAVARQGRLMTHHHVETATKPQALELTFTPSRAVTL